MSTEARAERLARIDSRIRREWLAHFVSLYTDPVGSEQHRVEADKLLEQRHAITREAEKAQR